MRRLYVIALCAILNLSGCTATPVPLTLISGTVSVLPPTAAAKSTVDPAMKETEVATNMATHYAGATATINFWKSVTSTEVLEFTATPASAGLPISTDQPVLVFRPVDETGRGLWMVYADGSGMQRLVDDSIQTFAVAPGGSLDTEVRIAYVTRLSQVDRYSPLVLKILTLPGRTVATVMTIEDMQQPVEGFTVQFFYNLSLAWSHDGKRLVFPAEHGARVNLEMYTADTQSVSVLSTNEDAVGQVEWSPDDLYVIYNTFKGYDADGLGPSMLRVVSMAEQAISHTLIADAYNWPQGWTGGHTLHIRSTPTDTMETVVVSIDVATGSQSIWDPPLGSTVRYFPSTRTFLYRNCVDPMCGENQWILHSLDGKEWLTSAVEARAQFSWIDGINSYVINQTGPDDIMMSTDGTSRKFTAPDDWAIPFASDDNQYWAWCCQYAGAGGTQLWISDASLRFREIDQGPIHNLEWAPDSHRVLYLSNGSLFTASAPDFNPVKVGGNWSQTGDLDWFAEWIQ